MPQSLLLTEWNVNFILYWMRLIWGAWKVFYFCHQLRKNPKTIAKKYSLPFWQRWLSEVPCCSWFFLGETGDLALGGVLQDAVISTINRKMYMSHLMTKPTMWLCAQRRLRSAWASAWVLSYPLSAQRRLWSDWADAQADLSLRWAHRSFCWFCHEAAHIKFLGVKRPYREHFFFFPIRNIAFILEVLFLIQEVSRTYTKTLCTLHLSH